MTAFVTMVVVLGSAFIGIANAQDIPVKILAFRNSTCEHNELDPREKRERLVELRQTNETLTFVIASRASCGLQFLPKAKLVSGELWLDWIEAPGSEPMECSCCYELEYTVKGISPDVKVRHKGKYLEITSEPYYTHPIQFQLRNGDTVNYVDKYERRQGRFYRGSWEADWIDGVRIKEVAYYPDRTFHIVRTSDIGKFTDDFQFNFDSIQFLGLNHYVEYFENGAKKVECQSHSWKVDAEYRGHCQEWDEKGKLIYQGNGLRSN